MKTIYYFIALLLTTGIYAQVGIGNETPRGLLDVNDNQNGDASAGLVLPHTNNPAQLQNPQTDGASQIPGTIAYDSEADCIKFIKNDNTWSDCIAASGDGGGGGGVTPPPNLPPNIILRGNQTHFIASANDTDYLPFTTPTGDATTDTNVQADGTADTPALDVQGTLTTTGVTIRIPYTVTTAAADLPAFSQSIEIPADLTEDNTARMVEFSYPQMTYQMGDGFVEATLRSTGGDLNAEKLDLQAGLGSDFLGVLMATFTYATDNSGGTGNVFLRDIPGIPDRNFGQPSADGDENEHNFIYLPVTAEDGRVWLNNNLGANYSNISRSVFNPAQQATSQTDFNAYGSSFQWGRLADGHELINYTSSTAGTSANGTTTTRSTGDVPGHSNFILAPASPGDWRATPNNNLWQGQGVNNIINNPCPQGFRLPTPAEFQALIDAGGGIVLGNLRFSNVADRTNSDSSVFIGFVLIWASTPSFNFSTPPPAISSRRPFRADSRSVRCIQN